MKYMKKYISTWMMIAFILMALSSCQKKEDFLNLSPLDKYSDAAVWESPGLMELYVNGMYRGVNGVPFSWMNMWIFCDESNSANDVGTVILFNKCLMTPDNYQGWEEFDWSFHTQHYRWNDLYKEVRKTNVFLSKVRNNTYAATDTARVNNLIGQVYFMRGCIYHFLTCLYGGVPIITKAYGLNEDYAAPRNTYDDCIKFITSQLDSAAMYLQLTNNSDNLGRVTKGAAMALKARVLLYAASPLHNQQSAYAPAYSNPELLGYTGGDEAARWTAAKDAAKKVIDLGLYSLYKAEPAASDSLIALDISKLFLTQQTEEDIFTQYSTVKTQEDWGYNVGLFNSPNGWHCWGNGGPLSEVVDDYEMKDGSAFSWSNPVHKASPYTNRDARLYATIFYEGSSWIQRPGDVVYFDPWNKFQAGAVVDPSGNVLVPGVDTRQGPVESWNGSWTNYNCKKYIDPSVTDPNNFQQTSKFPHIRYAEVLLNYAEACIELGQDAEARTYINMVRHRAGQPDIPGSVTGDELRQKCRHERRIELAFEDHRFWDIRRWMICPQAYQQTHAADVKYVVETTSDDTDFTRFFVAPPGYTGNRADKYRKADGSTWGTVVYNSVPIPQDPREWNDRGYFFPIKRDEMNKNTALIQNPGYE
jgi:hypothetical protein